MSPFNLHSPVTSLLTKTIFWRADCGQQCSVRIHNTSYLRPWPRSPRLVQYLLSRLVLAFRDKISQTRSVKFTSKITFHPTKHLILLALRFPIVSVQSPLSHLSASHASQTSLAHASCRDVNCCMVTGIMYGQHSPDFLSLPPHCAGPGMTPDNQQRESGDCPLEI